MAGVVKKLFRKLPNQRIVASSNHRNSLTLAPIPLLQRSQPDIHDSLVVYPASGCSSRPVLVNKDGFEIYPSFSFGYFLNLYAPPGFCQFQPLGVRNLESDESRTMWADSVKKKRKRKMNKHKLRKLRRRLRGRS